MADLPAPAGPKEATPATRPPVGADGGLGQSQLLFVATLLAAAAAVFSAVAAFQQVGAMFKSNLYSKQIDEYSQLIVFLPALPDRISAMYTALLAKPQVTNDDIVNLFATPMEKLQLELQTDSGLMPKAAKDPLFSLVFWEQNTATAELCAKDCGDQRQQVARDLAELSQKTQEYDKAERAFVDCVGKVLQGAQPVTNGNVEGCMARDMKKNWYWVPGT